MRANTIVSFAKEISKEAFNLMVDDIDFLGCSELYVEEKIDSAIYALKELKRQCKSADKRNNEFIKSSIPHKSIDENLLS